MDQLPALIRDPAWQFVGAVLTLVGVVLTLWGWRHRPKRALAYQILSQAPLVTVADDLQGRISITLDGHTIDSAALVLVKILNNGNMAIRHDEFERPISLGRVCKSTTKAECSG